MVKNKEDSEAEESETSVEEAAVAAVPRKEGFFRKVRNWLKNTVPGVALCAALAVPAWFLGKLVPVIGSAVFAIVFGMSSRFSKGPKFWTAACASLRKRSCRRASCFWASA